MQMWSRASGGKPTRVEETRPPSFLERGSKIGVGVVGAASPSRVCLPDVSLDTLITHSARVNRKLTNHRSLQVSLLNAAVLASFLFPPSTFQAPANPWRNATSAPPPPCHATWLYSCVYTVKVDIVHFCFKKYTISFAVGVSLLHKPEGEGQKEENFSLAKTFNISTQLTSYLHSDRLLLLLLLQRWASGDDSLVCGKEFS